MVKFDPGYSKKQLAGHLQWFVSWVIVTGFALYLSPDPAGHGTHTHLGLPACPSVSLFGRLCPGCGLTTSFTATIHGRFDLAWQANPFGTLFYLLFTISAIGCGIGYWRGSRFNTDSRPIQAFMGVLVALYLGFGVWRFTTQPVPTLESQLNKLGVQVRN